MPFLGVGWTLNIEMFFYFLFAFSLLAGRTLAPLLCATILTALFFLNWSGVYHNKVLATYGHNYVIFFVFGMICHYAWQLWTPAVERYRFVSITLAYCILVYGH